MFSSFPLILVEAPVPLSPGLAMLHQEVSVQVVGDPQSSDWMISGILSGIPISSLTGSCFFEKNHDISTWFPKSTGCNKNPSHIYIVYKNIHIIYICRYINITSLFKSMSYTTFPTLFPYVQAGFDPHTLMFRRRKPLPAGSVVARFGIPRCK